MKTIGFFYNYLLIFVLSISFSSCSIQQGEKDILSQAERIVEQQPDSALRILQLVLFPENFDKSRFNKYNLLLLEAKDKCLKDISSDTIIFTVKDYYLQKKDYPNAAMAAYYCGRLWHERDNMSEAVKAYMEAEKLADKTDNSNLKGLIQSNLGILHKEHSSYDTAIEFAKNAVGWYNKAKNYKNEISVQILIGNCFGLRKQIDSAFYYYNKSLNLAVLHNMPKQQSDVKNNMGATYMEQGNYDQAKKFFQDALTATNDSVSKARTLLNIAQVYEHENNADSVNTYLDKAFYFNTNNPWLIRTSYLLKSKIAEKNNRYQDALNDYKEYYNYTIKVWDNNKNNELQEVQAKYDFAVLRTAKKDSEAKFFKLLTISSLVLLASVGIIFIYYMRYAHNKSLLMKSEQKVERLQKAAEHISKKNHNILHKLVSILGKTALLAIDFSKNGQEDEKRIVKKINRIVFTQEQWDWEILYQTMNDARNCLYDKVRTKYPQLSEEKFRICCLTCETEFTDKEIGKIIEWNVYKVRRIRSELRKELEMAERENFLTFFENELQ